jgi:hypothetical protein
MACGLFGDQRRPALCDAFAAEPAVCGDNREQAMARLESLVLLSLPDAVAANSGREI